MAFAGLHVVRKNGLDERLSSPEIVTEGGDADPGRQSEFAKARRLSGLQGKPLLSL